MRLTQGAFSYLPDLSEEQIEAQLRYALGHGWAIMIERTDDPHPRNALWELCGQPRFDVPEHEAATVLDDVLAACASHPHGYMKVVAYDRSLGRQTTALSFIVSRPATEPGFRLERIEQADRRVRYSLHAYATDAPPGSRYA